MTTEEKKVIIKRGFKFGGLVDFGPQFVKYLNPDKAINIKVEVEELFLEIKRVVEMSASEKVKSDAIIGIEGSMSQLYKDIHLTNFRAETILALRNVLDLTHKKMLKAYPVRNDQRRLRELGEYNSLITDDSPEKCPYSLPDIILIYDRFFQFMTGRPVSPEKFFRLISLHFVSSKAQGLTHTPETVKNAYYRIFEIDYNSAGKALRTFIKPKDEKRQRELIDELIKPDESLATS